MATRVLSMRIDGDLLDRIATHAAKRGMSVQDYVVRTLMRDDFDERLKSSVHETERFYEDSEDRENSSGTSAIFARR